MGVLLGVLALISRIMATQISKLHKQIMRRVYYAYALRLVTLPGIPQGFLTLFALIGLTYFVSLGSVLNNIRQIPVGNLDTFAYNAVTNTDAWTLLFTGLIIFSLLSFRFKMKTPSFALFSRAEA
jgi:hypothetical protein